VLLDRLVPEREPLAREPLRDDELRVVLREDADLLREEPEPVLRAELEREPLDERRDAAGFRAEPELDLRAEPELDLRADEPLDRELDDDLRVPPDDLRVPLDDDLRVPPRDRLDEELDRELLDRELLDRRRPEELRRSAAGISSCATAFVSCGISLAR